MKEEGASLGMEGVVIWQNQLSNHPLVLIK